MVKVQYISDIHLEFRGENFKSLFKFEGDILCLAGDICAYGNPEDYSIFVKFLEYVTLRYHAIIHVPGNHEYYTVGVKKVSINQTMQSIEKIFKSLENQFKNYYFLNCRTVTIQIKKKKIHFCGVALWAGVNKKDTREIEEGMNDYNYIYYQKDKKIIKFNVPEMTRLHRKHKSYIKRTIQKYKSIKGSLVVVTHHKPVADTPSSETDVLTQVYETDLTNIIISPVKYAIHGHTHKHYKRKINGVIFLSNPLGYIGQHTKFIRNLTFNV